MFDFNFHIHDKKQIDEIMQKVTKILKNTTMANETLQELKDLAQESSDRLDNIAGDIIRILDGQIPEEGGLTAAEVTDLRSTLTALRDKAKGLDEQNEATPSTDEPQP